MKILVVEDDEDYRAFIETALRQKNYQVTSAKNGEEALEILEKDSINFVISDWRMPAMSGVELCRQIRERNFDRYIYILLLTAKAEKQDLIEGMDSGADGYMVKTFEPEILEVYIRAGMRFMGLEQQFELQKAQMEEANKKLTDAYSIITKELKVAARMQQSLLPDYRSVGNVDFEWLFLPSQFVAGDILNYFKLGQNNIGFYVIDVSGHGVSAAMLSMTLTKFLTSYSLYGGPLIDRSDPGGGMKIRPPKEVMGILNKEFQSENDDFQYFTMLYGVIDVEKGEVSISQAGHPYPFLSTKSDILRIGDGGFPVGMIPDAEYTESCFEFSPGDRLTLYSDGLTECHNNQNELFSEDRLRQILEDCREKPLSDFTDTVKSRLVEWNGGSEFADDVTLLALEIN